MADVTRKEEQFDEVEALIQERGIVPGMALKDDEGDFVMYVGTFGLRTSEMGKLVIVEDGGEQSPLGSVDYTAFHPIGHCYVWVYKNEAYLSSVEVTSRKNGVSVAEVVNSWVME